MRGRRDDDGVMVPVPTPGARESTANVEILSLYCGTLQPSRPPEQPRASQLSMRSTDALLAAPPPHEGHQPRITDAAPRCHCSPPAASCNGTICTGDGR